MPGNEAAPPGSPNPFASGVQFAKRKKNLFKGPTLNFGASGGSRATNSSSHSRNTSASGLGRRSGEITIQEEDEDYVGEEEEEIEEVESFNPIVSRPGEIVEEEIIEDSEPTPTKANSLDSKPNKDEQGTPDGTAVPHDQPAHVEARA
jgi:hypothetical protein